MKIINKQPYNKKVIASIILIILLGAGATYYALTSQDDPARQTPTTPEQKSTQAPPPTSKEQLEADAKKKEDFLNDAESNQTPGEAPSESSIELATRAENDSVVVTTKIQNATSGICTLTATDGTSTITKKAEVIYTPTYSTCAGFSIGNTELSGAKLTITVAVESNTSNTKATIIHTR